MTYKMTYCSSFDENYCYKDPKSRLTHETTESYTTEDIDLLKKVIRDTVDAPSSELTLEAVHKDFDSHSRVLSDQAAQRIAEYYNGRLELMKRIKDDLEQLLPSLNAQTFMYNIPEKYNSFTTEDPEDDGFQSAQNKAYIKIEVNP